MNGNLPDWPGADKVYARVYALLDRMAKSGHVRIERHRGRTKCYPSDEMLYIIDALNKGDEEALKAVLLHSRC